PATRSSVSGNGPSVTVRFAPSNLTRAPLELGWRPSPASMTPALTSSSLYLPIAARSSRLGSTPASDSLLAFTSTMNRIVSSFCRQVERGDPESTRPIPAGVLEGRGRTAPPSATLRHPQDDQPPVRRALEQTGCPRATRSRQA